MKKSLIALALAGAFSAPTFAQSAAPAAEAAPASDHTFTGNAGLFSEYRFRGIAQTFAKPAFQGGFDYSHSSGFYVGNWNSNVNEGAGFPQGNLDELLRAITTKLWPLGDDVAFVPGHGPMSTFGEEKRTNPYVSDSVIAAR